MLESHDEETTADNIIEYSQDFTYFKFFDVTRTQGTNMFFKSSIITMKDDIWDFFGANVKKIPFSEPSNTVDYYNLIPADTPVAKREYV